MKISISGGFRGTPSESVTVKEIAMHELGHAFSVRHHQNDNDLMGVSLGHTDGTSITLISECDLDGFEESHHWLTEGATVPHVNHVPSITCPQTEDFTTPRLGRGE